MENQSNDFIKATELAGVLVIERPAFADERGFFRETFRKNDLEARVGFPLNFTQGNHSRSSRGTLRGIHCAPWHKLVTVLRGEVQQIIVDLRKDSPTFGKHVSINMGEPNFISILIPAFCGNAFLVTSEVADYNYSITDYWAPGKESYVKYDDPDLGIKWQIATPIVSAKDQSHPTLKEAFGK